MFRASIKSFAQRLVIAIYILGSLFIYLVIPGQRDRPILLKFSKKISKNPQKNFINID